jgi:hypothetical protein
MLSSSPLPAYQIKRVSFTVPGTKPGTTYTVTADPKDGLIVDCTCPDHRHRRRECKHMRLVASGASGIKPRVRIGPDMTPTRTAGFITAAHREARARAAVMYAD